MESIYTLRMSHLLICFLKNNLRSEMVGCTTVNRLIGVSIIVIIIDYKMDVWSSFLNVIIKWRKITYSEELLFLYCKCVPKTLATSLSSFLHDHYQSVCVFFNSYSNYH